MNVPAIAKKTYEELKTHPLFQELAAVVFEQLKKLSDPLLRARFVHQVVDELNQEVFANPLVKEFSPCKIGCSGCCHTQVSVTIDEAHLLVEKIKHGLEIDKQRLMIQMNAGNDSDAYYKIKYEDRKCIFLGEEGACRVYEDRPSVCRTNAVLGDANQCDTRQSIKPTRLVKTPQSGMAIYASFVSAEESGTLPSMVGKLLK